MHIFKTDKFFLLTAVFMVIISTANAASRYPRSTLNILSAAKRKLKKCDYGRSKAKEIAFKSAANSLKREMKLLIRGKRLDQAKAIRSLIQDIEKASPGEEIPSENITSSSKKIIKEMNQKCLHADNHYEKKQEQIQTALVLDIKKEMVNLDRRGQMNAALNVQQLLKTVKSSSFDLSTFDPSPKKVVVKEKPKPPPKPKPEPPQVAKIEETPKAKPAGSKEIAEIRSKINKNDLALMTNLKIKAFRLKKKYPDNPQVAVLLADLKKMTAPKYKKCPKCAGSGKIKTVCKKCNGAKQITCTSCIGSGVKIKRLTCSACNGKGKTWLGTKCKTCHGKGKEIKKSKCPTCDGSGKATCPQCKGSGTVEVKCTTCNGSGKVKN